MRVVWLDEQQKNMEQKGMGATFNNTPAGAFFSMIPKQGRGVEKLWKYTTH
jgi:hypothetical protein